MFVSDISAANGKSIEAIYIASWEDSYERELGRRCLHFNFGTKHPTKTDWDIWNQAFNTSNSRTMCLSQRLGDWVAASPRIWRVFYDELDNCMEVLSDTEGMIKYKQDRYARFT